MSAGFNLFKLDKSIIKALSDVGYDKPTSIQEQAIPIVLSGKDMLGLAQTGTGKTAAFSLPILQKILEAKASGPLSTIEREHKKRPLLALILAPTRELAAQIGDNIREYARYTKLRSAVVFGGVKQGRQVSELKGGVDILVAAPGRLLDLIQQDLVSLADIRFFVLDEADRMLDMGFIHDIRRVIKLLPPKKQTLLFSATMPDGVRALAETLLHSPSYVEIVPSHTTVKQIDQFVLFVDAHNKKQALLSFVNQPDVQRSVVFTLMKHEANRITEFLQKNGLNAMALHGNKSQNAREKALQGFRDGAVKVLVATDIAARGIDVDDISHVFNYDIPNLPESYVHRIGRTGRAGRAGVAISLCEGAHRVWWNYIERVVDQPISSLSEHKFYSEAAEFSKLPPPSLTGKKTSQGNFRGRSAPPRKDGVKRRPQGGNLRKQAK
ncbi:DEAD/DEAH box helicase [Entomobacter blattae]|uniref:ATP-dependent RNA helicase RhlE n=1 Tax=Entomobacter blattae TaxID=2762277 RepID=A0A7H1NUM3_9PROT|nr:DEAD/DEAH box helicase [Entomobacter blattae]QNT79483.1 ATP-dependent RNA helicase RhlE [Entomobacter blattae]